MVRRSHVALVLAAVQPGDLVITQLSPRYGAAHLDHLGVPHWARPLLPFVEGVAVSALLASARRPAMRSVTGAALVPYYLAAMSFHVRSRDSFEEVAPAALCAVLAGVLVRPTRRAP